jgi:homoserine dehydrogenase
VLQEAQRRGYAEAEPSLDIDGHDALHKTGILASLAHGFWVNPAHIYVEGIRNVSALDIRFAQQLGYTIKLLGIIKQLNYHSEAPRKTKRAAGTRHSGPRIQVSVYPTLVPDQHVLANVNDVFNAVFVRGDVVGDTSFYGRGAGKDATASAICSDLADAALDLKFGSKLRRPPFVGHEPSGAVAPMDEVVTRYFVRLQVMDAPGTLARTAKILADAKIGISSVIQPEGHEGESVPLVLMLHDAPNGTVRKALARIGKLKVVRSKPVMIRVESFE